jgi:hypothetical protein
MVARRRALSQQRGRMIRTGLMTIGERQQTSKSNNWCHQVQHDLDRITSNIDHTNYI